MSEISSGLVAVRIDTDGYPLVRLSDAEAIIAQKDAEIIEQCRLNGMGAERELALLGQIERQSAALKRAMDALKVIRGASQAAARFRDLQNTAHEALAAINDTAQTIINSAKVEVDYMRVSGAAAESSFMEQKPAGPQQLTVIDDAAVIRRTANGVAHAEKIPGATVTTHKMR